MALPASTPQLSDFGLLVLDECHHCSKAHPYSCLMADFYEALPQGGRPQVGCWAAGTPVTVLHGWVHMYWQYWRWWAAHMSR